MALPVRSTYRSLVTTLLLLLAVVFSLSTSTPPAHAEASFTFRVRGYGHGLGMSQYGAKGFAEVGVGYRDILRYYYGNGGRDPKTAVTMLASEPARDVNLDKAASYTASSATYNAGYTRTVWSIRPGHAGRTLTLIAGGKTRTLADGWTTFTGSGSSIVVRDPSGTSTTYTGTVRVYGGGSPPLVQVLEPTGHYNHSYVRFRGEMRLAASAGRIKLVNRVTMRDYLYGVVPRESPASWHAEALKAQAVAARSYSNFSTRTELYTDTRDQVYGGHSRGADRAAPEPHEHPNTSAAVDATSRQMVTYNGTPIQAFFFSTSGGYTENNENVWGGTPLGYVRGVPDPYEVHAGASRHTWTQQVYTASQVRTRLASAGLGSLLPAEIAAIRVKARGVSGRPTRIEITGTTGTKTYIEGSTNLNRFKNAFGWGDRWFVVNPKTYRIAGADRYDTSVKASLQAFSGASTANVAVVVGGKAPADALSAAGLAGAAGGGPVLVTPGWSLDSRIRAEIVRLAVDKVYVVGGTAVVSETVRTSLAGIPGVTVTRLSGVDRYETAARVADEIARIKGQPTRAIIVNGQAIADGVVASGLAYAKDLPIVLVRSNSIPPASLAVLSGVSTSLVVGGSGVVNDSVVSQLPGATRIAGGWNRYATAVQLGDYIVTNEGFRWNRAYITSGTGLVDALSIGPTAGLSMHPVLLTESYTYSPETQDRLATKKSSLGAVWVVGGEAALSGWVQTRVEATLE